MHPEMLEEIEREIALLRRRYAALMRERSDARGGGPPVAAWGSSGTRCRSRTRGRLPNGGPRRKGGCFALRRGRVNLTIPPGTSSGVRLRLRGQGIRGGDHVARVMITVPGKLTSRQRELLEELGKSGI